MGILSREGSVDKDVEPEIKFNTILLIEQKVLHLAFVSFEYLAASMFLAESPAIFAPERLSCRKILSQFQIGAKKMTETN